MTTYTVSFAANNIHKKQSRAEVETMFPELNMRIFQNFNLDRITLRGIDKRGETNHIDIIKEEPKAKNLKRIKKEA